MDRAVLARFQLPGPLSSHDAVAKNTHPDDCSCRECRVNSVMPKIVSRVNYFRDTLRPRERHAFDVPDVLQEMWLELMVKDDKYDPSRSKYITFAMLLVQRKLGDIRNRWHTVAGPKDTAARLRATGEQQTATAERIRQTVREMSSLAAEPGNLLDEDRTPDDLAMVDERRKRATASLMAAVEALGDKMPMARQVLSTLYGLGRREPTEVGRIAAAMGLTVAQVIDLKNEGERELRSIVRPSLSEDLLLDLGVV